jgi:hypothetical protein
MQKSDSSVIKIIAVMNMVRGSIAAPLCRSLRQIRRTQKVQRMSRPAVKGNVSCAGEGAITARPLLVAFASLRRFAPVGNAGRRRGCSATATSRCACARCLRTCVPVTKPPILGITGGMLEALLSVLQRPSMDGVSLCRSHHNSESGQGRYRHRKLAHRSLPLSIYGDATTLDCINLTSTSYFYDIPMSTLQ